MQSLLGIDQANLTLCPRWHEKSSASAQYSPIMKCEAFERERATLVSSQNWCVVGKAERDSSQIYSYEVEARNDEEAALKAEDTRQVRDVCIFRINGMEVFL